MRTLVTGANGHLGYNLVGALLRAGHSVRASVRTLADPARTDHLRALGDVELVEADVLQPEPSLREIAETLHRIDPSIRLPLMKMPTAMAPLMPFFDRLNHRMLGSPLTMTPEMIATFRGKIWNASNARAKREFGWQPTVSLEQSLRDTVATIRARDARRQRTTASA